MKVIVGLGNPGKKYEQTRHNVGFLVLDELCARLQTTFAEKKSFQALLAQKETDGTRLLLCKPQTFMNNSGETLKMILAQTPATPQDVIAVYDDADLRFGEIKMRVQGSSAGHNGMQSLIEAAGTNQLARVRIGIGRPSDARIPLEDWVLQKWSEQETEHLPDLIAKATGNIFELLGKTH